MCDPLVGGLIAGAASIASGVASMSEAQDVQNKQQQANDEWVAQQKLNRQQFLQQDAALRNKAEAARQDTLQKISPDVQKQNIANTEQRLTSQFEGGGNPDYSPVTASGAALSGQKTSGVTKDSFSNAVNQAVTAARGRIASLATASSYGAVPGGFGLSVPLALQSGGQQIGLASQQRQNILDTYNVQKQIEPLHYVMGPNAGLAGTMANALAGVAGKGLGYAAAQGGGLGGILSGLTGGGTSNVADNVDWAGAAGTPDFSNLPNNIFNIAS